MERNSPPKISVIVWKSLRRPIVPRRMVEKKSISFWVRANCGCFERRIDKTLVRTTRVRRMKADQHGKRWLLPGPSVKRRSSQGGPPGHGRLFLGLPLSLHPGSIPAHLGLRLCLPIFSLTLVEREVGSDEMLCYLQSNALGTRLSGRPKGNRADCESWPRFRKSKRVDAESRVRSSRVWIFRTAIPFAASGPSRSRSLTIPLFRTARSISG